MSEFLREELDRLFAIDDQLRAEFAQHEAKRERMVQKQHSGELIYKTYEPKQQPASATMDAATEAKWNEWVQAHIRNAFAEQPMFTEEQVDVIAETISLLRAELRTEFETKLGELRADMNVQTGIARGEIKELKRDVA